MVYGPGPTGGQNYKEQQIMSASPVERVVLLYNGAIKFLLLARAAIDEKNIQERYTNNKKAIDIINYLQSTLDMEKGGEIASNLYRIYAYMTQKLVDVDMKNDQSAIDDVVAKLKELNASWIQLAKNEGVKNTASSPSDEGKETQSVKSFNSTA